LYVRESGEARPDRGDTGREVKPGSAGSHEEDCVESASHHSGPRSSGVCPVPETGKRRGPVGIVRLKNLGWRFCTMAKLVYGMHQSLDGYVERRAWPKFQTVLIQRRQRSATETVQIAAIVIRTEKTFRFMSIRFSAIRQYCCYSKH